MKLQLYLLSLTVLLSTDAQLIIPGSTAPCVAGQYEIEHNSTLMCAYCDVNTYCHDGVNSTACPLNSTTNNVTGATAKSQCHCDSTFYRDGNSDCTLCAAGYRCSNDAHTACGVGTFSLAGASVCTDCPLGTFGDTTAQSECETCPAGPIVEKAWTGTEYNPLLQRPVVTGNNQIYIMRTFMAASQGKNLSKWSFYASAAPCTITPMVFSATVDGRNNNGNFYYTLVQKGAQRTVTTVGVHSFDFLPGELFQVLAAAPEYVREYYFFGWAFTGASCIPYDTLGASTYVLEDAYDVNATQYYFPETLPLAKTYSVQITYTWTTEVPATSSVASTSIFACSCGSGREQLSDGNCRGHCIAGMYFANQSDSTCTLCEQGYYCVNSVRTVCPNGYESLPGSYQCFECAGPGTHTNIALYMCGLLSCPDAPLQPLGPYWRGLGNIAAVVGGSAGNIPQTPWFPGTTIARLALNPYVDRPVAILQRELTLTPDIPVAFQFRVMCTGVKCNEVQFKVLFTSKSVVEISSSADFDTIYSVTSVSNSWSRISTVYVTTNSSHGVLRIHAELGSWNAIVWMDAVRIVSLADWSYDTLSGLHLQESVASLTEKRATHYNETIPYASVMKLDSGASLAHTVSTFGPSYPYYVFFWAKGESASVLALSANATTPFSIDIALTPDWTLYEYLVYSPSSVSFQSNGTTALYLSLPAVAINNPIYECQTCLQGHWCSGQHIFECPDHSTATTGQPSQSNCHCLPGYYGNQLYEGVGYSPCSICPVNYWCNGTNHVEVCPPGTKSVAGQSVCSACEENEFCANGQVGSCPVHSHSASGSYSLLDCICDDGYFGTAPDCLLGLPGTASYNGSVHNCTENAISPPGATSLAQCYCDRGYFGIQNQPCLECESGYWCWTGIKNNCPINSGSLPRSSYTTNCSCNPGYYGPDGGPCAQCSTGSYKNVSGTSDCVNCPSGTFSATPGATSISQCGPCEPGYYNPIEGQYECQPCPAGSYSPYLGASSCQLCWQGSYSSSGMSTCTTCSSGTRSSAVGATSASTCQLCQVGSWSAGNTSVCVDCGTCYYWSWPSRVFLYTNSLANVFQMENNYRYRFCRNVLGNIITQFRTMYRYNEVIHNVTNTNILFPGNSFNAITALPNSKYIYAIQPPNLFRVDTELNLWDTVYPASLPEGVLINNVGLWVAQSDGLKCLNPDDTAQIYFFPMTGGANWVCAHDSYPDYVFVTTAAHGLKRITIATGATLVLDSMQGLSNCEFTLDGRYLLLAKTTTNELWAYSMYDAHLTKIMSNAYVTDMMMMDNTTVMVGVEGQGIMYVNFDIKDSRDCSPGKYSSYSGLQAEVQCSVCPVGGFCPGGYNISECSPGTYTFSSGLRQQEQCHTCPSGYYCPGGALRVLCPSGSYSIASNLVSEDQCQICPINYYCPNSTMQLPCPANTLSAVGGSDLGDCKCAPGFKCELTKVVHAEVILPFTITTFTPELQLAYKEAVALAAGVNVSHVTIIAVSEVQYTPGGGRRRMLSVNVADKPSQYDKYKALRHGLEIHTSIYNTVRSDVANLNEHLNKKGLPQHEGVRVTLHKEVITSYKLS